MKIYHSKKYLIEQLSKKNYIQIAKENNVNTRTIQRWMKRYYLTKEYNYWNKEEMKLLKENYEYNPNVYRLFPNRTISSINHKASKLGLPKLVKKRKYKIYHDFFKKWNPKMAYILGFFLSDGNVSYNRQNISIHLNQKDHYILGKIKKIMGSNRPISVYSKSSYLRLDSKILANDLINLGCTPRKSKKLKFININDKYLSHFIRGYFDGDGSIHFNRPNTIKISFVGTREFLDKMQFRINKLLQIKNNPIKKIKSVWCIYYYGDDARRLCYWMYKNSKGLYLKRKKERFDRHINLRKKEKCKIINK